jgi:hypothetical protein
VTQPNGSQPSPVIASLDVLQAQFEALMTQNQASFADLNRRGIALDPFTLVHARINHLIDAIARFAGPDGPRWSMLTRVQFEQYIAGEIATAAKEGQRVQLAQGGSFTPTMIRDLARQTGTLRPH